MSQNQKQRERLVQLLKELFQLNEPDLDFGLYRIMHAKAGQVTKFLEEDLLNIITDAFGQADQDQIDKAQAKFDAARQQAEDFGLAGKAIDESTPVKKAKTELEQTLNADSQEGDVYEHLYRFFERYYDAGDFMSRRYFARETDTKAAPYSVPYDGREVYMHWANKDQYYIKSSEHLSHFTFHLSQSEDLPAGDRKMMGDDKLTVECRVVDGSEGEHNNVKASDDAERNFMLHEDAPVLIETDEAGQRRLILQFEYKALPGKKYPLDEDREKDLKTKYRARNKGDLPLLDMSDKILEALPEAAKDYKTALSMVVETDSVKERPLLAKYLRKYTARNTMDYFIHKDLGGFLRRELDFYIKNEVMRLDDIDTADAPDVTDYLKKIQVLRRIGRPLIEFLAQLEDFQKKLWLKKKFVTETQYCITLDRIPEEFYPEIAASDDQREEWIKLYKIESLTSYCEPLSIEFLKSNNKLLVDTAFLPLEVQSRIIHHLSNVGSLPQNLIINSENNSALKLISKRYNRLINCFYADPPYNTTASEILYKNNYRSSSWMTLIQDRMETGYSLLKTDGLACVTIDDAQSKEMFFILEDIAGKPNVAGTVPIRINPSGRPTETGFAQTHEYAMFLRNSKEGAISKLPRTKEQSARFNKQDENGKFEIRNLRREGSNSDRKDGERQHYPIFANLETGHVRIPKMEWRESLRAWNILEKECIDEVVIWPITDKGVEKNWRWSESKVKGSIEEVFARIPKGKNDAQVYFKYRPNSEGITPTTLWYDKKYSATEKGTKVLIEMMGDTRFSYPKSIHAVEDCLYVMGMNKPFGTVLDFFAGSGTTGNAIVNLNRTDNGVRKYILIEMGNYFDHVTKVRMLKAPYASKWKAGNPTSKDGLSHAFKYIRLESYEDALNNLQLSNAPDTQTHRTEFHREYMLKYMLEFETKDSPSLLNIQAFKDPENYMMMIRKPGSEEAVETRIDLVETFNWLIGLHVYHLDRWHRYDAAFEREEDSELPEDGSTRLRVKDGLTEADDGKFAFRKVTGFVLDEPGNMATKRPVMVIWRKLTGDAEKDNAALEVWFTALIDASEGFEFKDIYVNGSCHLESLKTGADKWRVHLLEEAFHKAMWDVEE